MKVVFPQCMDCENGVECYTEGFERCRKIENAGQGLGIQVKQKDNSYLRNIPFGVYMGLKHIVAKVKCKDVRKLIYDYYKDEEVYK